MSCHFSFLASSVGTSTESSFCNYDVSSAVNGASDFVCLKDPGNNLMTAVFSFEDTLGDDGVSALTGIRN